MYNIGFSGLYIVLILDVILVLYGLVVMIANLYTCGSGFKPRSVLFI